MDRLVARGLPYFQLQPTWARNVLVRKSFSSLISVFSSFPLSKRSCRCAPKGHNRFANNSSILSCNCLTLVHHVDEQLVFLLTCVGIRRILPQEALPTPNRKFVVHASARGALSRHRTTYCCIALRLVLLFACAYIHFHQHFLRGSSLFFLSSSYYT